ncbi:MAG TPA: YajQ family cyclic di-GMP-binding protein [Nitrospiria bacterium]|nr:YajQ family cyclic di-GMP-binding protein [Nitrospiria bacterium]
MAAQYSFDIVSKLDLQEVRNAVDQAMKEIRQRFDFKGSKSDITIENDKALIVVSDDEFKLKSVMDILHGRLIKRGISPKALSPGKLEQALGGTVRQKVELKQGLAGDDAKLVTKLIKESGLKVQTQIQGDQLRVMGKSKDDLQAVMTLLRAKDDLPVALQFTNYR